MAVFRVQKNANYTTISNYHLRDTKLSLKAKGLLSQMLSLPDEWDYTLSGLAQINREGKDAIRTAVQELEQAGYINRRQTHDSAGNFAGNEYIIHEQPTNLPTAQAYAEYGPEEETPLSENPTTDAPSLENPTTEPLSENPLSEKPSTENPTQLNKDISSKDNKRKNKKKKPTYTPLTDEQLTDERLTDEQLSAYVIQCIKAIAPPSWTNERKNALFLSVMYLYSNERPVRKARPMRTETSVRRTFEKLQRWAGDDPRAMLDILEEAVSNGWQGIHPPHGQDKPAQPAGDEVVRTWL